MNRVGVCIAGMNGAVASTCIAGVALLRRGLTQPFGLLSERYTQLHNLVNWKSIYFAGWDPRGEDMYQSSLRNEVIGHNQLQPIVKNLANIKPWKIRQKSIAKDVRRFKKEHHLERCVILNLLPTGMHRESEMYAQAAVDTNSSFVNFTPNDCGEGILTNIPYCGRDGKSGQTWLKSVLAPAFVGRDLRVTGWYSTNLLGNEDGRVVGDLKKNQAKLKSKSELLPAILGYEPHQQVQINYYPPRGDNKESWDSIDFEGFLGMPMQIKINALWRDSILAAPMCIDLVRFMDLAHRRGAIGPQEWLSLYFKSPYGDAPHEFQKQERLLAKYLV